MKLTDLNFRILTPTPERACKLLAALTRAGVSYSTHLKPETAQAMSLCNGHFSFWRFPGVDGFDNDPLPELTFTEALELLAQVEAPTPTFDIKLRDEVLCRHSPIFEWNFKIFTRVTEDYFSTTGHVYEQLIPFKGNEHLHGETTTPDGWWEVESGQPVWRCK
jgi:hypothetical protein